MSLPVYVIYRNPSDYPGLFVVRRQVARPGRVDVDSEPLAVVKTLEAARAALPAGLYRLHREEDDDPVIEETWI